MCKKEEAGSLRAALFGVFCALLFIIIGAVNAWVRPGDPRALGGRGKGLTDVALETEALILRPARPADLDVLFELWTHPSVRRFLFDDREISRGEAKTFLERSETSFDETGYGLWLFFEKATGTIGGFAGLLRSAEGEPSLIFGTDPRLWGRGYAFQGATAVLAYAFETLGLVRVAADVDEPNEASVRVLEKLGMRRTGRRIVEGRPLLDYEIRR
ncbi:MAG TPA: GNAT family N-acetyltransferase [Vicinamibacteria bacterium]|nr:GNAT family N-acetyltransferase [Vicinamibacteria bacterium]